MLYCNQPARGHAVSHPPEPTRGMPGNCTRANHNPQGEAKMTRIVEMEMAEIVRCVMDNGRAATQIELENEFEFAASERGWTAEEIRRAIESPWFPEIK